jgi:hypothetical protein
LDLGALNDDALKALAATFDEVSTRVLDPIPNLDHDATRREIDESFMKMLHLPDLRVVDCRPRNQSFRTAAFSPRALSTLRWTRPTWSNRLVNRRDRR